MTTDTSNVISIMRRTDNSEKTTTQESVIDLMQDLEQLLGPSKARKGKEEQERKRANDKLKRNLRLGKT